MKIEKDCVVQFHYSLKDQSGELLETTEGKDPMAYLHGHKNIIAGLEKQMQGRAEGDKFTATVEPKEGYGERKQDAMQRIPLKHMQGAQKWKKGMVATVQTDQGQRQVVVEKVGKFNADCDLNHPLAGKTLSFDIEVVSVREASQEERSHGHAHGVGGHHH